MELRQFPKFNRQEADVFVTKVKEVLGPDIAAVIEKSGLGANQMVRFMYIGSLCKIKREEEALDLKTVSKQLNIPQYKLTAVEGSSVNGVLPEVLHQYADLLGIDQELEVWKEENSDIWNAIKKNAK